MNALLAIDSAVQAERRLTLREIDELHRARAAIAELIEADMAYDAARRALAETDPQSEDAETMEAMRAHRNHCIARRAAALYAVGGSA